jgi:hypothetical protein
MIRGGELSRNIVIPNGFLEAEQAIFRANLKVYRELKRPRSRSGKGCANATYAKGPAFHAPTLRRDVNPIPPGLAVKPDKKHA